MTLKAVTLIDVTAREAKFSRGYDTIAARMAAIRKAVK